MISSADKYLNYVNLSFGIECCFNILIWIWHIRYFFVIFAQPSYERERPVLKMHILWCSRGDILSSKPSGKLPMLGNPFPIAFLCKLNRISVWFIQISTKITCKQLIPIRESHVSFQVIPSVLNRSVKFNIS